jgi:flagellar biosynthesis regulator FlbT
MNKPINKLKIRDVYKYKISLSNSLFTKKYVSRIFRIKNVLSTINKYDKQVSFFSFSIFLIFYLQDKKVITKKDITSYNIWFFLSIYPFFQEERMENIFKSKRIIHLIDNVNKQDVITEYNEIDKEVVPIKIYESIYRQVNFLYKVIEFMIDNIIVFINSDKKEQIRSVLRSYA